MACEVPSKKSVERSRTLIRSTFDFLPLLFVPKIRPQFAYRSSISLKKSFFTRKMQPMMLQNHAVEREFNFLNKNSLASSTRVSTGSIRRRPSPSFRYRIILFKCKCRPHPPVSASNGFEVIRIPEEEMNAFKLTVISSIFVTISQKLV